MEIGNLPFDTVIMLVVITAVLGVIVLLWRLRTAIIYERLDGKL